MIATVAQQTRPGTANAPRKSPPAGTRTIPAINCTDQDSMAACKSFKQLVEARDTRIIEAAFGGDEHKGKHFSYACFTPKTDTFSIVSFNMPKRADYRAYWLDGSDETIQGLERDFEKRVAFNDKLPRDSTVADQWYDDHPDYKVYAFSGADMQSYENGILADWVTDWGKWSIRADNQHQNLAEATASFEGAWAWLERLGDGKNFGDDLEEGHITVDESNIHVHYSFKNNLGTLTDYSLNIQRSTGRFKETFVAPGAPLNEDSGACWIFRE